MSVSIGKFEGIEEPLARIGSAAYTLEAMRIYCLGALDKGIKPGVITAMQKYYATEIGRKGINDAMDIMGGAGISAGSSQLISRNLYRHSHWYHSGGCEHYDSYFDYLWAGALRSHPFAYSEVRAYEANYLKAFDKAFMGHIGCMSSAIPAVLSCFHCLAVT